MTFLIKGAKSRHKARFATRAIGNPSQASSNTSEDRISNIGISQDEARSMASLEVSSNPSESADEEIWVDEASPVITIPGLFTTLPPLRDRLVTDTTVKQDGCVKQCLPFLSASSEKFSRYNSHGVPNLDRARHIKFLHKSLGPLPAPFAAADAARPWFFYWALCALSTFGEDVSSYRECLIGTVRPLQNSTGGFAGGYGQMSHLATTYACVLSLAIVGGEDAIDTIDRKAMWKWLVSLKQTDGGFRMFIDGEEDVRGAYCAALVITLLDLPIDLPTGHPAKIREDDNLLTKLGDYIGRCQSFEGGISSRPDAEAHGAYAFCALACLCLLGDPKTVIPKYLDVPRLIDWLSARQYAPEGGFAGRTNKLVDGCYSHWIGACWPLIEACLDGNPSREKILENDSLYSREGLIRYILCCGQDTSARGGLRDKPSTNSDAYHTCYVSAGLSSAQHKWKFDETPGDLSKPYRWTSMPYHSSVANEQSEQIFDEVDRVKTLHPVFVVPEGVADRVMAYCATKERF